MKEQLISFETAKLAKEKGFKLGIGWHGFEDKFFDENGNPSNNHRGGNLCRPTQSLLQKWLRVEHNIEVNAVPTGLRQSKRYLPRFWFSGYEYNGIDFKTHEEALEIGLQEALKLI